jgi:drug/metabolite transporter (DMT)-like permease
MSWILYATIAAAALAAADVLVKVAAGKLPNSLATLFYGAVAFGVGLTWYVADRLRGNAEHASTAGIVSALGVGAAFSAVAVALYGAFRAGAPLSVTAPVVRLSGVIIAGMFGVFLWNEPVTPRYIAGVCLSVAGVYLIVTR